jgi:hypothetical protein
MNRRSIFTLSAIAALTLLALPPTSSLAQQGTLQAQLVGTWTIVSYEIASADGAKRRIANPKGVLIFDAGGRYAQVVGRGDRPKFKTTGQPTTEELAAATTDFFAANAGTWSIAEADKTLTRRFDAALRPNTEGTDQKDKVSLAGDELRLTRMSGAGLDQVYRRAR